MNQQIMEVVWYLKNGKYPNERIVKDSSGIPYVIGDWAWNRNDDNPIESIEPLMPKAESQPKESK